MLCQLPAGNRGMTKRASPPPVPPPARPATPQHDKTQPIAPAPKSSGKVQFDERGQAVWTWAVRTGMFDRNASTQRMRALTDGPVKLELEQTLTEIKRESGARPAPGKAGSSFNPYENAKPKPAPKEPPGTDPYSRGN